jgi:hypothetical protein
VASRTSVWLGLDGCPLFEELLVFVIACCCFLPPRGSLTRAESGLPASDSEVPMGCVGDAAMWDGRCLSAGRDYAADEVVNLSAGDRVRCWRLCSIIDCSLL